MGKKLDIIIYVPDDVGIFQADVVKHSGEMITFDPKSVTWLYGSGEKWQPYFKTNHAFLTLMGAKREFVRSQLARIGSLHVEISRRVELVKEVQE